MKIIKYLFLIAILLFIGLTVYVSTQSPQFKIERTKIIKTPINEVYNYVNDLKNWSDFIDQDLNFTKTNLSPKTAGINAKITFIKTNCSTVYQIVLSKPYATINIVKNSESEKAKLKWYFKDTLGATKVTVRSEGSVDLKTKIKLFFQGGLEQKIGNNIELDLEKLSKRLQYEIDTFKIIQNGVVTVDSTFCIRRTIICYEKDVQNNIKIVLPQLQSYFQQKKIKPSGQPFVDIQKSGDSSTLMQLSVCIPVSDSIYTAPNGVFKFAKIDKYRGLKATLQGNTVNMPKLWLALKTEISKKAFIANKVGRYVEVYKVGYFDTNSKTKWITEVIIPQETEKPKYLRIKRPTGDTTIEPGDLKTTDSKVTPTTESSSKIN